MPLIKITVQPGIDTLHQRFKEMVDDFLRAPIPLIGNRRGWMPPVDVCEAEDELLIVAEVAGVDKESLSVVIEGEWLQVYGARKAPFPADYRRFFQVEIEYGPFERIVRLPVPVDPESAEAVFENGLLLISFRKRGSKAPIKIQVNEE